MRWSTSAIASTAFVLILGNGQFKYPRALALPSSASHGSMSYPLAPPFMLSDLEGRRLDLVKYKGKVVLLDFWATWCAPCQVEIPHFVQFQKKYEDRGLQVVGISMDDGPEPVRAFYSKFNINYPVAMGTLKVAKAYGGVLGLPVTLLIGRDGRIHSKHIGPVEMPALEREIKELL